MRELASILFYVDGDLEPAALDRAVEIAESAGARLVLAAVVEPCRSKAQFTRVSYDLDDVERLLVEDRQRDLDEAVSRVDNSRVEIATRVFTGGPVNAIIQAVQKEGFDLLLKSPTPAQGLRQKLFGGVDMRLMRACPCPVHITRLTPKGYSGHAVVAVDYDEQDEIKASLNQEILDSVALILGAKFVIFREVHIAHAWSLYGESILAAGRGKLPPDRFRAALKEEEEKRTEWLTRLVDDYRQSLDKTDRANFHPILSLLHGDPMVAIPELVKELDADVLAMGTVSRTGIGGVLMGNTAEAILNRVSCSVVTHKPKGFQPFVSTA